MPTSVTPSPSVNFNTVKVLSSGSGSGSGYSAPSRPFCFRISTRWSGVSSWSWEFNNSKTSSASYLQTFALGLICRVLKKRTWVLKITIFRRIRWIELASIPLPIQQTHLIFFWIRLQQYSQHSVPWWASNPDTWTGFEISISCLTCFPFPPLQTPTCSWDRFLNDHSDRIIWTIH